MKRCSLQIEIYNANYANLLIVRSLIDVKIELRFYFLLEKSVLLRQNFLQNSCMLKTSGKRTRQQGACWSGLIFQAFNFMIWTDLPTRIGCTFWRPLVVRMHDSFFSLRAALQRWERGTVFLSFICWPKLFQAALSVYLSGGFFASQFEALRDPRTSV